MWKSTTSKGELSAPQILQGVPRGGTAPHVHAPTAVGDNCYIGPNSVIAKGVIIGDGCVVGAGSVVLADLPPGSKAAGAPARVIGASSE